MMSEANFNIKVRGIFDNQIGLVLQMPLDEGTGNIAHDCSGKSNNGTIYGSTWVNGKYGKALTFDGVDDYVEVSDSSSLDISQEITIVAWFKTSVVHDGAILWKPYTTYNCTYGLAYYGIAYAGVYGRITDSSGNVHSVGYSYTADGKWHHLAMTYDGSVQKLYFDASLVNSISWTGQIATSNYNLTIGDRATAHMYFNGFIDEVRIYNRVLTQDEISNLFLNSFKKSYLPNKLKVRGVS